MIHHNDQSQNNDSPHHGGTEQPIVDEEQQRKLYAIVSKWRQRATKRQIAQLDTFHRAIKRCIVIGQIFGILPLVNTLDANPQRVEFRMPCLAMIPTMTFLCFGSAKALTVTNNLLDSGLNSRNIVGLCFYYINITVCLCFLNLARDWPKILLHWTQIELRFLGPPYNRLLRTYMPLHRKLPLFATIFLLIALMEHSLWYGSEFYNFYVRTTHCSPNQTAAVVRLFVQRTHRGLFVYLPYNLVTIAYAFFLHASFNVIWNFLDLFIMLVSLALARRFQQFAAYIHLLSERATTPTVWYAARQDHVQLCELLAFVDNQLSNFVLISALNNTYFICNALLNIFTKLRWTINYVYFWSSLAFLLGRTSSVFLCAATIHEAARQPLQHLYLLRWDQWSDETERLTAQITSDTISLTGKRFFNVTRKNLFGLLASIVTYELMLLQLDASNAKSGLPDLCA